MRVAALQMKTSYCPAHNAEKICAALDRAAAADAEVLVTPECALTGYLPREDLDFPQVRDAERRVGEQAASKGIWVALGTTRVVGSRRRNSALLCCPDGRVVGCYDKTHLMPGDEAMFEPGDSLPVFTVGEWTIGLQICFDIRFPENWRILRLKGAEAVFHLSNASRSAPWKAPVLGGAVRSRAAENGMLVVSANDANPPQMYVSAVCDPDGKHLACAGQDQEDLIFADLERAAVNTNFLDKRRTDLWGRPENRLLLS